jgi:hypothetical protein
MPLDLDAARNLHGARDLIKNAEAYVADGLDVNEVLAYLRTALTVADSLLARVEELETTVTRSDRDAKADSRHVAVLLALLDGLGERYDSFPQDAEVAAQRGAGVAEKWRKIKEERDALLREVEALRALEDVVDKKSRRRGGFGQEIDDALAACEAVREAEGAREPAAPVEPPRPYAGCEWDGKWGKSSGFPCAYIVWPDGDRDDAIIYYDSLPQSRVAFWRQCGNVEIGEVLAATFAEANTIARRKFIEWGGTIPDGGGR